MQPSERHEPDLEVGFFRRFIHSEVSGSAVLLACTLSALLLANSPWAGAYFRLASTHIAVSFGTHGLDMSLSHWIGDGLMTIFFFVVGLEIKREVSIGQLASLDRAILPICAALGGMIAPALIYAAINLGSAALRGWGVPMATDIAFALGILAIFGSRVPIGLKVFLTALAIADDLGAVIVIALFYSEKIVLAGVLVAALFMGLIALASRLGVRRTWVYLPMMVAVWVGVLASGIHATVAGVLLAMLVPVRAHLEPGEFLRRVAGRLSQLENAELTRESMISSREQTRALDDLYLAAQDMRPAGFALESALHPLQAFLILPAFALFKAGIPLDASTFANFPSGVSLGVIGGLVLGKPIGILFFSWLAIRSGRATLPEGVNMSQLLGVGALGGVGFTMSIFVSELAFSDTAVLAEAKLGILIASVLAAALGYALLARVLPGREA